LVEQLSLTLNLNKMKNFTEAAVSYKGEEVNGLALPYSIQRLTADSFIPEGYISIGKQRFENGLRICFIHESLITKTEPRKMEEGEEWVSGYKTNLELEADKKRVVAITKECFAKDSSENHKNWMINCAKNRMGLNSFPELAEQIVNENWK